MKKTLLVAAFLLIFGCATKPPYDPAVFYVDKSVSIKQLSANSVLRKKDGHTIVNIHGLASWSDKIYYKVEWYDANGMMVKSLLSTWNSKNIIKDTPFVWEAVSPNSRAVGYKVYLTKNLGDGVLR